MIPNVCAAVIGWPSSSHSFDRRLHFGFDSHSFLWLFTSSTQEQSSSKRHSAELQPRKPPACPRPAQWTTTTVSHYLPLTAGVTSTHSAVMTRSRSSALKRHCADSVPASPRRQTPSAVELHETVFQAQSSRSPCNGPASCPHAHPSGAMRKTPLRSQTGRQRKKVISVAVRELPTFLSRRDARHKFNHHQIRAPSV